MNFIEIQEVNQDKIINFADVAMWLNLSQPELVEELLETYTDFTDMDIIEEIVDTLKLPLTCVVETTNQDLLVHGYIRHGEVVA